MKKTVFLLSLLLLMHPISVYADPDIYEGGNTTIDISGDSNIYHESSGGDYNEDRKTESGGGGSSGTRVQISPAEKAVANSKNDMWSTLRGIPLNIKQKFMGENNKHRVYAGTGKLTDNNYQSLISGMDNFLNNSKKFGGYDANDLPKMNFGDAYLQGIGEIKDFGKCLGKTSDYKSSTGRNEGLNQSWNSGHAGSGGSGKNGSGKNGSGNSGSNGSNSGTPGSNGSGSSGSNPGNSGFFIPNPLPNGSNKASNIKLPNNYGKLTFNKKNGLLSLNNENGRLGSPFKVGDFSKYATDFMQGGILDSPVWSNRYKTLKKYYQSGMHTALGQFDDVAYVTDYCVSSRNAEYYKISDYSSTKRRWRLSEGSKTGEWHNGTKMLASIHFGKRGKYTFEAEQWAKITQGTAVHYFKRQYLILIPTNTMLYFKEEETGPVILNEKVHYDWVNVTKKTFNVKGLGGKDIQSGVERIK